MSSTTEGALAGLLTVLQGIVGPTVERNVDVPVEIKAGGHIVLRDGDPGEPEVVLSPVTYHYEHVAEAEVVVQADDATRDTDFDTLLGQISTAINADRTLGGTVDYAEVGRPGDTDIEPIDGANGIKQGVVPITLTYGTTDPLN